LGGKSVLFFPFLHKIMSFRAGLRVKMSKSTLLMFHQALPEAVKVRKGVALLPVASHGLAAVVPFLCRSCMAGAAEKAMGFLAYFLGLEVDIPILQLFVPQRRR
jgi:hypothetical protein